ncbi:putative DNA binding protein [Mycobacteroides abscessus subsp. abscessus]|nr:putative DNA binding protein [Mycobacteroides abscessus subsp. abscessus]
MDVDDIVSLAVALQVSPMTLLIPETTSGDQVVSVTAAGELSASELLAWFRGDAPLPQQRHSADMHWTLPEWFIDEQDAQRRNSIHSQINDQQERNLLENDRTVLQGQATKLTETVRRQAETIQILVKKLAELGVGVRYRTSEAEEQANGVD